MKDVLDDEGRRFGPVSLIAMASTVVLSLAISYNALFAQGASRAMSAALDDPANGATTRLDVAASTSVPNTIQLKYDPVVEDVQRELQATGFYKGAVDGVVGRRTRDAIAAYQKANGIDVNGQPSQALIDHIRYTRQVAEATLFTGSVEADPDAEQRARVRRVQTSLSELAYYQGDISGEMNSPTHQAISAFEHDHGMADTGDISDQLLQELSKVSGQSEAAQQP
jgi:peptidoglycan hydrolase-like protein with peptidoglycan-binding domain